MQKKNERDEKTKTALPVAAQSNAEKKRQKSDAEEFARSVTAPLGKNNEKRALFLLVFVITAIVLLLAAAVADLLMLAFQIHRVFGYVCVAAAAAVIVFFVVRPFAQVLRARSFVTDVTAENKDLAKRKNYRALKQAATELMRYNRDEKTAKFRYVKEERLKAIESALKKGNKNALKKAMRTAYASDVGAAANAVIFKSAGRAFLTTSVSQNDKIDALSVLLVNLSLIKQIVAIYGYRPTRVNLVKIYAAVLRNSLIAYGMQNVNWFNVFGKFFSGVTQKIPFLDTLVDSAVQGTVSAFLTLLIGYKTKRYLCSDYKKQEKIDSADEEVPSCDDEVKIAASLAKKIRKEKGAQAQTFANA